MPVLIRKQRVAEGSHHGRRKGPDPMVRFSDGRPFLHSLLSSLEERLWVPRRRGRSGQGKKMRHGGARPGGPAAEGSVPEQNRAQRLPLPARQSGLLEAAHPEAPC